MNPTYVRGRGMNMNYMQDVIPLWTPVYCIQSDNAMNSDFQSSLLNPTLFSLTYYSLQTGFFQPKSQKFSKVSELASFLGYVRTESIYTCE